MLRDGAIATAEVDLGLARRMHQRHVHLGALVTLRSHGALDNRVAAVVAVLGPQAVVDTFPARRPETRGGVSPYPLPVR